MLRIVRALRFWMCMHVKLPEEENSVFQTNNRLELLFTLISIYKEATKSFSNQLLAGLLSMSLSEDMKGCISEYNSWLLTWKEDDYLVVVHNVRNCLCFHFDPKIYNKYIHEGETSEDLLFGIADGERWMDVLYIEPSSIELNFIADAVPDSVAEGQDKIDWIWNKTVEESSKFMKLINEVIREILKGYTYKKEIEI